MGKTLLYNVLNSYFFSKLKHMEEKSSYEESKESSILYQEHLFTNHDNLLNIILQGNPHDDGYDSLENLEKIIEISFQLSKNVFSNTEEEQIDFTNTSMDYMQL